MSLQADTRSSAARSRHACARRAPQVAFMGMSSATTIRNTDPDLPPGSPKVPPLAHTRQRTTATPGGPLWCRLPPIDGRGPVAVVTRLVAACSVPSVRWRILATAVTIGCSLAGCAGGEVRGDSPPAAATRAFFAGIAHGDQAATCRGLTRSAVEDLRDDLLLWDSSCGELVQFIHDALTPRQRAALLQLKIRRVTVHGDRAEIADRDLDAPSVLGKSVDDGHPIQLMRIGGRWKITSLT